MENKIYNELNSEKSQMEIAKSEFLKYGCSMFAMARESDFYHEGSFDKLNIPEATLYQWSREKLDELFKEIIETGSVSLFAQLGEILENYCSKENLLLAEKAMANVRIKDSQSAAILAETLLGRRTIKVRDGLILKAYDLGERDFAHSFLVKAKEILSQTSPDEMERSRIGRDRDRCKEIEKLLMPGGIVE